MKRKTTPPDPDRKPRYLGYAGPPSAARAKKAQANYERRLESWAKKHGFSA